MPSAVPNTPCPFRAATLPAWKVNCGCLQLFFLESGICCHGPQGSAFWLGALLINQLQTFFSSCLQSKKVWWQMGRRFQSRYVTRYMRTQCKMDYASSGCRCCLEIVILPDFWLFRGCIDVKFTWLDFTAACVFWKFYFEPTLRYRVPLELSAINFFVASPERDVPCHNIDLFTVVGHHFIYFLGLLLISFPILLILTFMSTTQDQAVILMTETLTVIHLQSKVIWVQWGRQLLLH